jgi:hypothetical protein
MPGNESQMEDMGMGLMVPSAAHQSYGNNPMLMMSSVMQQQGMASFSIGKALENMSKKPVGRPHGS